MHIAHAILKDTLVHQLQ